MAEILQMPAPRGVAVVTGGTAGIGRAAVRCLAQRGWYVGIIAREEGRLSDTVDEVQGMGRRAVGVSADVASVADVEAAADRIEAELGPIELWVNNAFSGAIAFFDELTPEEYERITAVTYFGFVNGTRAALSRMAPRNAAPSSRSAPRWHSAAFPCRVPTAAPKHAIKGFTESVRTELLHKKLDVQLCEVHMPAVNTPQFDWVLNRGIEHHPQLVPPIFQPEVAAQAIAYIAEHPRRRMFVGTSTLLTVLANSVASAVLDRYLARLNVKAQQSPEHDPPGGHTNIWEPVGGADITAHGVFDNKAHAVSPGL